MHQGDLTDRQLAQFESWLECEENRLALDEALRTWIQMDELLAAIQARARARAKVRRRNKWLALVAAVAAFAVIGTLLVMKDRPQLQIVEAGQEAVIDYSLQDRSVVNLRPGTRLSFAVSDAERLARMTQGEALFEVATDPLRPFIVNAGEHFIKAVGTRFAIRLHDTAPLVIVQEGMVAVTRSGVDREVRVTAGEQLEVARGGEIIVSKVDAKALLKWARRPVDVSDMTIGEVVDALNRHNKVRIEIVDAEVARKVLNLGYYYLDEPEGFVNSLTVDGKFAVEHSDPETLRLSKGPRFQH
ncbi:FecR family protein [Peristeroidobacter soli]|uniref:FecR family protein n=1 Tax=Peristeroidobacter soli TaxID=2497877 RepID=UPI00101B9B18|nr:FecR domain-containing protein [Peristeroidobacter soli]